MKKTRHEEACRRIVALVEGFDEDGPTDPVKPLSWATVGLMAVDYARYAIDGPCRRVFKDKNDRKAECCKRKGHDGGCVGIRRGKDVWPKEQA